jgi:hypothetical protein
VNDDFSKYEQLKRGGASPEDVLLEAGRDGLDLITKIRLVRTVFSLDAAQAKNVLVRAEGWAASSDEHQANILRHLTDESGVLGNRSASVSGADAQCQNLNMPTPHVATWTAAPELAIPDPPAILSDSSRLWLAYATTAEPRGQFFAVVRFDNVIDHRLSPINDEGLGQHPCAGAGLKWYEFNEVIGSAEATKWRTLGARHWVVTFKDNTLYVLANDAEVIASSIRSTDPVSALLSVVNPNRDVPGGGTA